MQRNNGRNRLLLPPWMTARTVIASLMTENHRLRGELAEAQRSRDEFRSCLRELLAARQAREQAEHELLIPGP
jgi:hypothetical protein